MSEPSRPAAPPYLRGKMLAIVVPVGPPVAPTVAALRSTTIADLDLEVRVAPEGTAADARNRAAVVSSVDYLAFVDAGAEVPEGGLRALVELLRSDLTTGVVGWSPTGREAGDLDLFVSGRVCVARYSAFHAVGGYDVSLGSPVADVDFGWRLWLAGYRVRTAGPGPDDLHAELPSADALTGPSRTLLATVLDDSSLGPAWSGPEATRARARSAPRRARVDALRQRGDGEVLPLAHAAIRCWSERVPAASAVLDVVHDLGAPERAGPRRRIAVVTGDTLAARLAGPAIRALQIARRLAREHEVVLATIGTCELDSLDGIEVRQVGERGLRELERWCDVFVFQGWILAGREHLVNSHKVIVADIYDPMHLEQLEQAHDVPGERGRTRVVRETTAVLNHQLERADFMLCASAKQRDLWIGALAGLGRVNPATYDGDESLRRLLAVVPFGVGDDPPVQTRSAIRGVLPGIGPDDKIILWGGGVYNWFDPLTLVRAVDRLRRRVPEVRLVFLGMKHPNPGVPQMRVAFETQELARSLGLVDRYVYFNTEWVDFDDRHNHLLDADVGVSTHLDHLETEFSFRTRILDYLWAELPIVATAGDSFATFIDREGLGMVVPPCDVDALANALERTLVDRELAQRCRENIRRVSPALRWQACLEPLAEFCRAPQRAADVACPDLDRHAALPSLSHGRRRDLEIAVSLRAGGVRIVWDRARSRWRAARR